MDIGKIIRQRKFKSGLEKAYINLMFTTNHFRDLHAAVFKKHGILGQHYNVLRITRGQSPNPVTPGYIRDVMLDKGSDVTRLVDKLVSLGFIERSINAENKRKLDICITTSGLNVTQDIENELEKLNESNNYLTAEEYEILSDLLDRMRG